MGAMHEILLRLQEPEIRAQYQDLDTLWDTRARALNERLSKAAVPVQVANLSTIWTVIYTQPSRYNWVLQFYLRAQGLALSWVGTGRLIFSLNYSADDFAAVSERFVAAAQAMQADGWWWLEPNITNGSIKRRILKEFTTRRS
jgi:glutamate-1-semialdehyde 2,1-aminomutase